jgi:modification methylase
VLLASTHAGDIVLDPFFGTGTTGAAAQRLGRKWIGIERDADYARAARERIAAVSPLKPSALDTVRSKRAEPRVPFGTIIELGILAAGSPLYDERRRVRAEVKADGSVALPGMQGSIHRVGAFAQGKAACNGWTFWHFESEGKLAPIDRLRDTAKVRLGLTTPANADRENFVDAAE